MSRFDNVAKEWDSSQTRQQLAFNIADTILNTLTLTKEMHLLDFGAGTGLLTKHLCPLVGHITALDFSREMLKQLEVNAKTWQGCTVETVHSDILLFSPDKQFDGIVSSMSMHHIEDLDALFNTFSTLLKPEGFIAIADLEEEDGSFHAHGNEGVFHFGFDQKKLTGIAEKYGFTAVKFERAHTLTKENGSEYPLFLMTAVKA